MFLFAQGQIGAFLEVEKVFLKHFVARRRTDNLCNQIAVWRTMCGQNNEQKSQGKNPQHTINTDDRDSERNREIKALCQM